MYMNIGVCIAVVEIDECSSNPCVHGYCSDAFNFYSCDCIEGYLGNNCAVESDECASQPCISGTCVDLIDAYTCSCGDGARGLHCEIQVTAAGLLLYYCIA